MDTAAFKALEYDRIRAMLAARADSVRGKELALTVLPSGDAEEVKARLSLTQEAVAVYEFSRPPLGGVFDIREFLKKATLGAMLEAAEISDVLNVMRAMRDAKKFFKELEIDAPLLKTQAAAIEILGQLERLLENAIDEHGALRDDASTELKRIRNEMRTKENRVKERIGAMLHDENNQKFFQDAIVTVRDGRFCLPIKQEYKNAFSGIVHDRSASGATLFVEPMALVELNNDVKQLALDEIQERQRILRRLSADIAKNAAALEENAAILARIDFAFAKARLANDLDAVYPVINDEGRTVLKAARHPLIAPDKVVPIDIAVGEDYRVLLITGPNTGGKTVSMKTLGLLALMAQTGCFIPAAVDSTLFVYRNIYADIGDEQSIEQSLSTFSSHIQNIVGILRRAAADDLLLLDEIGAGTDPHEGAALAMAIIDSLIKNNISAVVTTHYSELKSFAFAEDGIENAGAEFDLDTLLPTYRLKTGAPGASNAFAVSARLGLDESLIEKAKGFLREDYAQFERVIGELEREKRIYEEKNADIMLLRQNALQAEAKAAALKEKLDAEKGEIIRKAREKAAALIRKTQRDAEETIEALKRQFDDFGVQARQKAIADARAKLSAALDDVRPGIMRRKVGSRIDAKKISVGDVVYVAKLDQKGEVLSVKKDSLEILLGTMKTNVKTADCRFVESAPPKKTAPAKKRETFLVKTANARREIDIRGFMVDEAEAALDKFIDDAVVAGLGEILIIHGKGTGALRKGVGEYLARHKNIASYNAADFTEGGMGATVAVLQ